MRTVRAILARDLLELREYLRQQVERSVEQLDGMPEGVARSFGETILARWRRYLAAVDAVVSSDVDGCGEGPVGADLSQSGDVQKVVTA
jgi:hypothetical protein